MDKSYKCFYCKHDTPPRKTPNLKCEGCKFGLYYEEHERLSTAAKYELIRHKKLDEFIKQCGVKVLDWQAELLHRYIESHNPIYCQMRPRRTYSAEMRAFRAFINDAINNVKLEDEDVH